MVRQKILIFCQRGLLFKFAWFEVPQRQCEMRGAHDACARHDTSDLDVGPTTTNWSCQLRQMPKAHFLF